MQVDTLFIVGTMLRSQRDKFHRIEHKNKVAQDRLEELLRVLDRDSARQEFRINTQIQAIISEWKEISKTTGYSRKSLSADQPGGSVSDKSALSGPMLNEKRLGEWKMTERHLVMFLRQFEHRPRAGTLGRRACASASHCASWRKEPSATDEMSRMTRTAWPVRAVQLAQVPRCQTKETTRPSKLVTDDDSFTFGKESISPLSHRREAYDLLLPAEKLAPSCCYHRSQSGEHLLPVVKAYLRMSCVIKSTSSFHSSGAVCDKARDLVDAQAGDETNGARVYNQAAAQSESNQETNVNHRNLEHLPQSTLVTSKENDMARLSSKYLNGVTDVANQDRNKKGQTAYSSSCLGSTCVSNYVQKLVSLQPTLTILSQSKPRANKICKNAGSNVRVNYPVSGRHGMRNSSKASNMKWSRNSNTILQRKSQDFPPTKSKALSTLSAVSMLNLPARSNRQIVADENVDTHHTRDKDLNRNSLQTLDPNLKKDCPSIQQCHNLSSKQSRRLIPSVNILRITRKVSRSARKCALSTLVQENTVDRRELIRQERLKKLKFQALGFSKNVIQFSTESK